MDNTTTSAPGGADWESGAAADALTQALKVYAAEPTPEHAEAIGKASRDMNAALGSRSMQTFSAVAAPLMLGLQAVRGDIAELSRQREKDRKAEDAYRQQMLTWRVELRNELIERFDAVWKVVDGLLTDFDTFRREQIAFNAASAADRAELRALIETLPQVEQLRIVKEVLMRLERVEEQNGYLLIAVAAIVLLFLLLILISVVR